MRAGKMCAESDGNRASAGADIEDFYRCGLVGDGIEDGFDEELGFGARDERVWRDAQGEAEEFLLAGEVLERFMSGAASGEGAELGEVLYGERVVAVSEKPRAIAAEDVREEDFRIATGDGLRGFVDGVAKSHIRR